MLTDAVAEDLLSVTKNIGQKRNLW